MKIGSYSLAITPNEGFAGDGSYIKMVPGTRYTIHLGNDANLRGNAQVTVDGEDQGTFRLDAFQHASIVRPAHTDGAFIVARPNSVAGAHLTQDRQALGLIQVKFTPELVRTAYVTKCAYGAPMSKGGITTRGLGPELESLGAAGTVLGEQTGQQFYDAAYMELDYTKSVTISLRLVAVEYANCPVSIRSVAPPRSNPVPSPLY